MIAWVYLGIAIACEVVAALSFRMAVSARTAWYWLVGAGYIIAFILLSLSLAEGMPLSVAYGVWTAAGVALTAILGRFLFKEPFTWLMALGVALIMGGVLLVEMGRL